MAAAEAAWSAALRTGDFGEFLRLVPEVRLHDLAKVYAGRLDALERWRAWKEPVVFASDPPADETAVSRFALDQGTSAAVPPAAPGRFDLAPGSYVAEIRLKGYATARLPLLVEWPKAEPKAGAVRRVPLRLVPDAEKYRGMVYVPEGEFVAGGAGGVRAGPRRTATLRGFFIDRCEVSGADYKRFLDRLAKDNPGLLEKVRPLFKAGPLKDQPDFWIEKWKKNRKDPFRDEDWRLAWVKNADGTWSPPADWEKRPVGGISCEAAEAYARSSGKRLPTSEEWEKAARGVDGRRYPWGMRFDENRVACKAQPAYTATGDDLSIVFETDSLPEGASPYGCVHMAGNCAEWTASDFDAAHKINRGGCSYDEIPIMRTSSLDFTRKEDQNTSLGFRCARDVE
jgi:formylglycine-generating enzyme required for sulfatase activity